MRATSVGGATTGWPRSFPRRSQTVLSCLRLRTSHRFLGNLDLLWDGRFVFVRRR
jgi:hypothetical protein